MFPLRILASGALYVLSYGGALMKVADTADDGKGDKPQIIRDEFALILLLTDA